MNLYKTYRWQKLRKEILRRDNNECQWCKKKGLVRKAEVIHHLKEADRYIDLFYEPSNLISLCRVCHEEYHGRIRQLDERFVEWW